MVSNLTMFALYQLKSHIFLFNFQAVLGVQIVITMVMASVMSKIGPFMSLARWLLTSTGKVS